MWIFELTNVYFNCSNNNVNKMSCCDYLTQTY